MAKMPPPGSGPGLTVVIGHDSPKPDGKMPPPGTDLNAPKAGADGKVSPEDAQVYREGQTCVQCENYDPNSGECAKVSGSFSPQDGCLKYFEPMDSDEPDADDAGGPSDQDMDDSGAQQQ